MSEWLDLMLAEIARKKDEADAAMRESEQRLANREDKPATRHHHGNSST